jgi:hypothetical protein
MATVRTPVPASPVATLGARDRVQAMSSKQAKLKRIFMSLLPNVLPESWNGDASKLSIYGSSSGGHVAELLAMRPRDPRDNAIPLPEAPTIDAAVAFVATRSPISDPFARFKNAEKNKRDGMVQTANGSRARDGQGVHRTPADIVRLRGEARLSSHYSCE